MKYFPFLESGYESRMALHDSAAEFLALPFGTLLVVVVMDVLVTVVAVVVDAVVVDLVTVVDVSVDVELT